MGAIPHIPTHALVATTPILTVPAVVDTGRALALLFVGHGRTVALFVHFVMQEGLHAPVARIRLARTLRALARTLLAVQDAGHFYQQVGRGTRASAVSIVHSISCTGRALRLVATLLAAGPASLTHSFLLVVATTALALPIHQCPRLRTATALQLHAAIVIGALLAVLGYTSAGSVQALPHHLHVPTDARTLPVAVEFPELLGITGRTIIGVLLASQAALVAQLASSGDLCFQEVVPSEASTGGAHFLEILVCSAFQAID